MDELAREYVISFYDKTFGMFGDRPEALGWTSQGQLLRYEALLGIGKIRGKKVLDFGCGKGDFYQFLKDRGIPVRYTGLDLNEKLIAAAREKHRDVFFRVFDIEEESLAEDFNYIFLCGVFNLNVQGTEETIRTTLKKLFAHCRTALAFNALSARAPRKDFALHYASPEDMFAFAVKDLSPFVSLTHDAAGDDFTLFVYRESGSMS
ncbi:MAG: class I SAM-dependent methyltransferase [Nitrospirae bacterium]|nr:class I SAM-dependent methyltransferase [Nitrospirota bacterium]